MATLEWVDYQRWLDNCLAEFNHKFLESRRYHQGNVPDGYDPGEFVEFGEDGTAYPHGVGGTTYIPNAVTPWKEKHYDT